MIRPRDIVFLIIGSAIAVVALLLAHYVFTRNSILRLYNATGRAIENIKISSTEQTIWSGDLPDGEFKYIEFRLAGEENVTVELNIDGAIQTRRLGYASPSDSFMYEVSIAKDGTVSQNRCSRSFY